MVDIVSLYCTAVLHKLSEVVNNYNNYFTFSKTMQSINKKVIVGNHQFSINISTLLKLILSFITAFLSMSTMIVSVDPVPQVVSQVRSTSMLRIIIRPILLSTFVKKKEKERVAPPLFVRPRLIFLFRLLIHFWLVTVTISITTTRFIGIVFLFLS